MARETVQQLYTRRAGYYAGYVQALGHRQGLEAVLVASGVLAEGQRILDAGCGTGLSILAIAGAFQRLALRYESVHGFDLTPAMLERCRAALSAQGIQNAEIRAADVRQLDSQLPASWTGYDLIFTASMLEHLPRDELVSAVSGLAARLRAGGRLLVVVTRRSFYPTRWGWHCEGYTSTELQGRMRQAGLTDVTARRYPWRYGWLNIGNLIIQGTAPGSLGRASEASR